MKNTFIKKLIKMLESSDLDSIQISSFWGMNKVKLFKSPPLDNSHLGYQSIAENKKIDIDKGSNIAIPEPLDDKQDVIPDIKEVEKDKNPVSSNANDDTLNEYHKICAPLVGTFYSAPKEDEPPFIQPGDKISEGQVICIIEAMKIFNEIESEVSGVVKEILVDNTSPVEYGQPIVLIDTDV